MLDSARLKAPQRSANGAVDDALAVSPAPGQIRLVRSMEPIGPAPRFVLILAVQEKPGFVSALLLTNETELASDVDVVLSTVDTGLPFSLLAETDLSAPFWTAQLSPVTAVVSAELTLAITRAVQSDFAGLEEFRRGLPLRGKEDARWQWKEHELAEVQALASSCLSAIQEGLDTSPMYLDPGLLPNVEVMSDLPQLSSDDRAVTVRTCGARPDELTALRARVAEQAAEIEALRGLFIDMPELDHPVRTHETCTACIWTAEKDRVLAGAYTADDATRGLDHADRCAQSRRLKAILRDRNTEIERLQAQVERLRAQRNDAYGKWQAAVRGEPPQ